MSSLNEKILRMVKDDTIAALGCTEPVAVAYAAASLNKYIDEEVEKMEIEVSLNIFKNGKSVYIPNTGSMGLDLAGVLGYLCGDTDSGFLVLDQVDEDCLKKARVIMSEDRVRLNCLDDRSDIYVRVYLKTANHVGEVVLEGGHTYISSIIIDGDIKYEKTLEKVENQGMDFFKKLKIRDLIRIAENMDIKDLGFLEKGVAMNMEASNRGLEKKVGLGIGYSLKRMEDRMGGELDPIREVRMRTAAAADARMSGENCPVMTSGGSGNQGLGVFLPIYIIGERENIGKDRLLRAIYLGHMVNRYVKIYTGKLSSLCGCAIASCVGAAAAITWMLDGDYREIEGACNTIFANLTGMICDGAKDTCAFKLATSAAEGVLASYLSLEGVYPNPGIGIVGLSLEETIENLGLLRKEGMKDMDSVIVSFI